MKKHTDTVVHYVPITKARINLGQIVKRVHLNKEYFILEKGGIPIAGIVDVDEIEDLIELQDPELQRQIRESYEAYQRGEARDIDELLTELRTPGSGKCNSKKT